MDNKKKAVINLVNEVLARHAELVSEPDIHPVVRLHRLMNIKIHFEVTMAQITQASDDEITDEGKLCIKPATPKSKLLGVVSEPTTTSTSSNYNEELSQDLCSLVHSSTSASNPTSVTVTTSPLSETGR